MNKKSKKTISQLEIAREIATELNQPIELVSKIIDMEQRKTMEYCKRGTKVIKKNYLTLTPIFKEGKKMHSALTNKDYDIKPKNIIKVTVGEGFKSFVNEDKPMKDKLCRFVDNSSKKNKEEKSN